MTTTALVSVVVLLLIVGVILWAISTFIPMDAKIKQLLNAVVVIALVLWLIVRFLLPLAKTL